MSSSIYKSEHTQLVKRLQKARTDVGLTQLDVAKRLGKSQSYISKVESGQRRVDLIEIKEFAKVYKKNVNFFIKE